MGTRRPHSVRSGRTRYATLSCTDTGASSARGDAVAARVAPQAALEEPEREGSVAAGGRKRRRQGEDAGMAHQIDGQVGSDRRGQQDKQEKADARAEQCRWVEAEQQR